jgi:hypothetical protein
MPIIKTIRLKLANLITAIQVAWMKRYGQFDPKGSYKTFKKVPQWVNRSQRALGYLSLWIDPTPHQMPW